MNKISSFLDSLDFSPRAMAISVILLAAIRLFLESFSSPEPTGMFAPIIGVISYASLYCMLIIMLALVITALTRKSIIWSLRAVMIAFPVILLTPLIDLIVSGGSGFCIGYAQTGGQTLGELFVRFLAPHGQNCGITPGLRFQIAAVVIGLGGIVFAATRSWAKAIGGAIGAYVVAFFGGTLPIIVNLAAGGESFFTAAMSSLMSTIHYPTDSIYFTVVPASVTTALLARVQMIGLVIGLGIVWYLASRETWRKYWKGFLYKLPKALIHVMLLGFGLMLGAAILPAPLTWPDWTGIIMLIVGLLAACSYVGIQNDINDIAIDRISSRDSWITRFTMDVPTLNLIAWFSLLVAVICSFTVSHNAFYCIMTFAALYSIHSSGLRLKRYWATSSFLIALSGVAAFYAGFLTMSPDQIPAHVPFAIPVMIAVLLIAYSIIKDIPDREGDQVGEVKTLPVIIGTRATIIAVAIGIAAWLVIFWNIIPWFLSLGVIATILMLVIRPRLVHQKIWLLGVPVAIWSIGLVVHIIVLGLLT